jgi:hypothetical protein
MGTEVVPETSVTFIPIDTADIPEEGDFVNSAAV